MPTLLMLLTSENEASPQIVDFLIEIAATGRAVKILEIVRASASATELEPLIVGLQIYLGEQPLVAQEILEIGQDVAQRIREQHLDIQI